MKLVQKAGNGNVKNTERFPEDFCFQLTKTEYYNLMFQFETSSLNSHGGRGKQVMLDSDLATLYECVNGAKTINQAVNRHLDRFLEDFYF